VDDTQQIEGFFFISTLWEILRIRDSKELKLILCLGLISNPDLKIVAIPLPLPVVRGIKTFK